MGAKPLPDLAATVADAHATLQARSLQNAPARCPTLPDASQVRSVSTCYKEAALDIDILA